MWRIQVAVGSISHLKKRKIKGSKFTYVERCFVWGLVMEQTRKIGCNLITLHSVPESI